MPITSPHNESLKEVRKLAGRKWRDKTRAFVAEGEDLIDAAAAAGWTPELLLCEAGSGLAGEEVAPHLLSRSRSSARAPARSPSTRSAGRPRRPGRCASRCGASTIPATSAPCCARRSRSARGASRSARARADPYGSKAVRASMGAIFAVPVVRVASVAELPGRTVALAARAGRPLQELEHEEVTLVVGAEREGLPADGRGGMRRGGAHPDPRRSRSTPRWRRRSGSTKSLGWRADDRADRAAAAAGRGRDRRRRRHRRAGGGADRLPRPQGRAAEPAARRRPAPARAARRRRPRGERGAQGARGRDRGAPRGARAAPSSTRGWPATRSTSRCRARPPSRSGGCT